MRYHTRISSGKKSLSWRSWTANTCYVESDFKGDKDKSVNMSGSWSAGEILTIILSATVESTYNIRLHNGERMILPFQNYYHSISWTSKDMAGKECRSLVFSV